VSTANVARDIDLIRKGLGEDKIAYFGYSYGTFLGATYASMFPTHYSSLVLDGPVDANGPPRVRRARSRCRSRRRRPPRGR
jgi:pimeloyl-ACP methyl ester carboxylesterase